MERFVNRDDAYWKLVRTLKRAIDPADIVSPGRYAARERVATGAPAPWPSPPL